MFGGVFETVRLNNFDVVFLRNNPRAGAREGEGADDFNPAIDFGRRLKGSGVLVVNDPDGLSRAGSKMYLAGFPVELRPKTVITRSVDRVRSFLRELDAHPNDVTIVQTITAMAKALGLRVAAEGVESEAQLARLRALGCDEWQGHHFSAALDAAGFEDLLKREFMEQKKAAG